MTNDKIDIIALADEAGGHIVECGVEIDVLNGDIIFDTSTINTFAALLEAEIVKPYEARIYSLESTIAIDLREDIIKRDSELIALTEQNAKLIEEKREEAENMLRMIADVRYIAGIAERGRGRKLEENESITVAVLDYVKLLEAQNAKLIEDAARYRWLRDIGDDTWAPFSKRIGVSAEQIDAAIDEALIPQPENREGKE